MSDIPVPEVEIEEGEPFETAECDASPGASVQESREEHYIPMEGLASEYLEGMSQYTTENAEHSGLGDLNEDFYADNNGDGTVYTADMFNQDTDTYDGIQKQYMDDYVYNTSFDEASNSNLDEPKEEIRGLPLACFNKITKNVEIAEYETIQTLYQILYQRSAWDTQEILSKRILEFSGFTSSENSEDNYNRKVMLQTQPNEMLIKLGAILDLDIRMMLVDSQKARPGVMEKIMEFIASPKKKTRKRSIGSSVQTVNKCGCRNRCYSKFSEAQQTKMLKHMKVLEKKRMLDKYLVSLMEIKKIIREPGTYQDLKKFKEVNYTYRARIGKNEAFVCKGAFCLLHGIKITKLVKLQNGLKGGKYSKSYNADHLVCSDDESTENSLLLETQPASTPEPTSTPALNSKETALSPAPAALPSTPATLSSTPVTLTSTPVTLTSTPVSLTSTPVTLTSTPVTLTSTPALISGSASPLTPSQQTPAAKSSRPGPKSSKKKIPLSLKEINQIEEELKDNISKNRAAIPKVIIKKLDLEKSEESEKFYLVQNKKSPDIPENPVLKDDKSSTEQQNISKKKLKDFSLVVKCLDEASADLLIDVHCLLFLESANGDKVKENILEFDGFSFDADTEEYDERNEFLQRMSNKLVTDVSRCLSLGILSTKEDTIKNILSFLMNPDENYLRATDISLSLSDVDFDDIGDMSDSDESITCEVVEKKVECIELMSSGDESDKEVTTTKDKSASLPKSKVEKPAPKTTKNKDPQYVPEVQKKRTLVVAPISPLLQAALTPSQMSTSAVQPTVSDKVRRLKNFETICKIVNTHPHEYLVDIYDLLYMQKHQPSTLRDDILNFSGFEFEKGTPEYVKRKQFLDRMLYNSVRRIYNTLIHNTTEVKVFSKPTMITEIFQFLFKLPDHDTSVRAPQVTKPVPNKTPVTQISVLPVPVATTVVSTIAPPVLQVPNQTGKLSDLKRVFQRVACFPCEYLVDVHKLLYMTDCDTRSIRQNIFNFKGFSFAVDSQDFHQRKLFLEYLTFHSLRKISSVLTTRSVDLRNSTKHELATHLTQVLAEYCNNFNGQPVETSNKTNQSAGESQIPPKTPVENIVVTPIIAGLNEEEGSPTVSSSSSQNVSDQNIPTISSTSDKQLGISIVNSRSLSFPQVTTTTTVGKGVKRKSTLPNILPKQAASPKPQKKQPEPALYADINLPEVEQYRQIYGQSLNIYNPAAPTITGITTINANGIAHIVPQTNISHIVHPYSPSVQVQTPFPNIQQGAQIIHLSPPVSQVQNKPGDNIMPVECVLTEEEPPTKKLKPISKEASPSRQPLDEGVSIQNKIREAFNEDEEDCDKPLASLIGHPIDSVLKKHIVDIVDQTDLQDITINGVIKKIFNMYPKYDLSYRKEFIKSTLRSILYRLGNTDDSSEIDNKQSRKSPECVVTTTGHCG